MKAQSRFRLCEKVLWVVFGLLAGPLGSPVRADLQMVFEGNATPVTENLVQLAAGVPVVFETRQLSANSDPVLHVFGPEGNEVAIDDNGAGNRASRLRYIPAVSGMYRLLVRARDQSSAGTCIIFKDDQAMLPAAQFGGWFIRFEGIRAKEDIATAILPRVGDIHRHRSMHALYLLGSDRLRIESRVLSIGLGMGPVMYFANAIADRFILVAKVQSAQFQTAPANMSVWPIPNDPGGPVRVMRNDAKMPGHDPDEDGLGTELEEALGTCPRLNLRDHRAGYNCAVDPRDTDGDGISDGWEVLGRAYDPPASSQPLPVWGANPRHKDLFIEVDFMRRRKEENDNQTELRMAVEAARHFAKIYGDSFTSDPARRSEHGRMIANPDGEPGISVHLDIGVRAQAAEDVTIYGDWGGYNAVNAIKGGEDDFKAPDGTYWKGVRAVDAWRINMSKARRGIFRYALAYGDGGGSTGPGFTASYNFLDMHNPAHETGHSMNLGHAAPFGTPFPQNSVNCKPNYTSIMNYAYYGDPNFGLSDGAPGAVPSLNNARLTEWRVVQDPANPTAVKFMDLLENTYKYWVDRVNGHVDWNRDGEIAPQGTAVRGYANYKPRGDCEYTRHNQTELKAASFVGANIAARTTQPPALARIGDRLYVFWVNGGRLWYAYSRSTWDCPEIAKTGCAGAQWLHILDGGMEAEGGVDVARIRVRSGLTSVEQLLVVTIDGSGRIWERRVNGPAGGYIWSRKEQVANSIGYGAPSVVAIEDGSTAYLVYKSPVGKLLQNRLVTYIGWAGEKYVRIDDGSAEGSTFITNPYTSPGLVYTYLSSAPGVKALYGVFAPFTYDRTTNGVPAIYAFNEQSGRWVKTDVIQEADPIFGRPAMAWVPFGPRRDQPGRLYLVYVQRTSDNKPGPVVMLMSYKGGPSQAEKVGLIAAFDNMWLLAYGVALLYERGVDTNLRALVASAIDDNTNRRLFLRPKADGIIDLEYTNYNDWLTLRVNLCKYVVNPAGDIPNPIRCRSS